jgi:hypothetical protein
MGCCSPFSAATTRPTAEPNRHVNFSTGMVLGVDDYSQEFAYHSGRDKWMVRDFLGYGTLSGLAVTLEDDGDNGPRVRVTAGSAAAPSGQLICVGRDQCGSINPWLARPETAEKLRTMLGGDAIEATEATEAALAAEAAEAAKAAKAGGSAGSVSPTKATLNLFLTLCYVDCAVAEVPIPGEPCRSDENLMAPSRIADDYCLDFCFEPPPMAEAMAIETLTAFFGTLNVAPGNSSSAPAFAEALRLAELQLRLAFGLTKADAPVPVAGDLIAIPLHPSQRVRFGLAVKRLWVTRIRPFVVAQRCGTEAVPANDCVLLGRLTVPVIKEGANWVVASPPPGGQMLVELDENERPILLSVSASQTQAGLWMEADGRGQKVAFMVAAGPIPIGSGLVIVRSPNPITITVPTAPPTSIGNALTIKSGEAGIVTIDTPTAPATKIDGEATLQLQPRRAVSLVSDGHGTWHVTGQVS